MVKTTVPNKHNDRFTQQLPSGARIGNC